MNERSRFSQVRSLFSSATLVTPVIMEKYDVGRFKAIKNIPNLKPSKVQDVKKMPYSIIHLCSAPLGQRFHIRKHSKLVGWSKALATSGYLNRALTDAERTFPFVKKSDRSCQFHVFGVARKYIEL